MNILLAFFTGLTTGGLSCLAVQGGLLASSLASQLEDEVKASANASKHSLALPILLFLGSKLIAYTLLGALLGYLGSLFQLTPLMRAILLFAIGIFMLGNAFRMLNVHPIFRFFSFEPPRFITRFIRRNSKNAHRQVMPVFLGALTVLIPCGVTQSMMALAVASGNVLQGAILLFAFTLGTSPVFFAVTYFASRLGSRLEKAFIKIIAVVMLILGFLSIDNGLNLVGSPLSMSRIARTIRNQMPAAAQQSLNTLDQQTIGPQQTPTPIPAQENTITILVKNNGYSPSIVQAPSNQVLTLNLITTNTQSCSRAFVIPALNVQELLPATGTVSISIPAQRAGSTLSFSCSMGMYSGEIVFN